MKESIALALEDLHRAEINLKKGSERLGAAGERGAAATLAAMSRQLGELRTKIERAHASETP